jgi:DNA adenine methylase
MSRIRPAFKCHGGKYYLSEWIISHFPENYKDYTYIEPYCGGANILINKEKSPLEAISDTDLTVIQIFRALRDEPKEFARRLNLMKYCQETFDRAVKRQNGPFDDYLDQAINEYVLRRMSRGGLRKAFAWSNRLRGGQPGDVNAWKTALAQLPILAERMKEVYIFNKPALEVIKTFNTKNVLVYADPPYLHDTRHSKNVYANEMTIDDHIELSRVLNTFAGKVVLSGYPSPLYTRLYQNWNCEKKKVANHSSQARAKEVKTEMIWKNF